MKNLINLIFLCLFLLMSAASVYAESAASRIKKDLVGVSMKPEHAEAIAKLLATGDIGIMNNNSYIKARDTAGTADISILKVDATDDTVLNADTGDTVKLTVAGATVFNVAATTASLEGDLYITRASAGSRAINASGVTSGYLKIIGASSGFNIRDTTDAADNLVITDAGAASIRGTFRSSATSDLGWSIVNAANQACNTTCTSACVLGFNTGALGNLLSCSDATADSCLCAGAS